MTRPNHRSSQRSPKRSPGTQRDKSKTYAAAVIQGVQFLQQNQLDRAKECFERAMLADPRDAVARNCLGIIARSERRLTDAMAFFHQSIELRPDFAEAHNNMGNVQRDTGNIDQAAECYRRALAIKPAFAEGHNNLGVALLAQGEVDEAVACFDEAIRLQPVYAEAHNNLANAYQQRGELIAAAASLATALQLKPASPEIHNNLANVLRETGQFELALQHYNQSVRLKPDFAEAYDNLGTVLIDLDRGDEAVAAYEQALQLQASRVATLLNLGNAYRLVGRVTDAESTYAQLTRLEPNNSWHRLRVSALCPPAFRSQAELEAHRHRALKSWPQLAKEQRRLEQLPLNSRLAEPAFAWQFLDGNLRPLKEAFAEVFADGWPKLQPQSRVSHPRVGIVVTSGHEGLFLRSLGGVIQRLNTARFDLAVVCPSANEAVIRRGLARDVELVLIPSAFPRAAEAIQAARFSVLYFWEIGTDATNYFLPFLQLAPIQCTSWGVQVTSGIRRVEYYLGSELVEPENAAEHYTERLLLSPTLLTYQTPPRLPSPAKTRGDFGFNDQQHLYVCAQQMGKFHPDFDSLLAEILRYDGRGIVVTVSDRHGYAAEIVRSRLAETMSDVADRVVFLPRLEFIDYLQLLNIADVLLDPPHFGGVNSTYDALAIGQPIITLPSAYHRGRYTASCLSRIGVTETIARDAEDYVRLAVALAADRQQRADLGRRIQQASPILFRDDRAVREHERLFELLIDKAEVRGQRSDKRMTKHQ